MGTTAAVVVWWFARYRTDASASSGFVFAISAGFASRCAVTIAWRTGAVLAKFAFVVSAVIVVVIAVVLLSEFGR